MLLHQGAASFTLWTGQAAPLEVMQRGPGHRARRWRAIGRGRARRGAGTGRSGRGGRDRHAADDRRPNRDTTDGCLPLPDRRGIARPRAGRDRRRRARRPQAHRGRPGGGPRPSPARLRPRRPPDDRAGPSRDPRGRASWTDPWLADPAARPEPGLGELDSRSCRSGRSTRRRGTACWLPRRRATSGRPRSPACAPDTRTSPARSSTASTTSVTSWSAPRRARPRRGWPRAAVARAFLSELGIEVWSFTAEVGGVALDPADATRSRDEADASPLRCPDPDAEARDGRAHRRGPSGRRHGRWRLRGRGPRRCRSGWARTSTGIAAWTRPLPPRS